MLLDSSDTHSVSSTSFISAVSSQEDLALVNLHMQVNKPIVESPLLMTSYINHLSQVSAVWIKQCILNLQYLMGFFSFKEVEEATLRVK